MNDDKANLYDYQRQGVDFLIKHKSWCNKGTAGGMLWDDPGLGKTRQAIVSAALLDEMPVLIVCPNTLKLHWRQEIAKIVPGARVAVAGKAGRLILPSKIPHNKPVELSMSPKVLERSGADWVIVHYTGLRLSKSGYGEIDWACIICDECHYIKNRNAARTKAVWEITPRSAHRIGLTATPWSRDPSDLWAQLYWAAPNVPKLQNYWRWLNLFTDYVWEERRNDEGKVVGKYRKILGGKNLDMLAQVMSSFGVCRRKSDVADQLPPITDTKMPLELEAGSRQKVVLDALADTARNEFAIRHTATQRRSTLPIDTDPGPAPAEGSAPGEDASSPGEPGLTFTPVVLKNVLARMMAMERWLSNPGDTDPGVKGIKMEWLEEWASDFPYPAVIVTRFKSSARSIAKALGVSYVTGDVSLPTRNKIIEQWRGDDGPQFLVGTIHTLGTGLNLERAYAMVCYDQVYNPILMTQVRERIHRITSEHPVEVIYLVVQNTSNEIVYESFMNKWKVLEMVKQFMLLLEKGEFNVENVGSERE